VTFKSVTFLYRAVVSCFNRWSK